MSNSSVPSQQSSFAMNTYSREAVARSQLYESVVSQRGFTLIPGRYGGEFNNDQLSIGVDGVMTLLLLGLKVTSEAGDIQLDQHSMGPHQQFSRNWLHAVVQSLKLEPTQVHHAEMIENALVNRSLGLFLLLLVKPKGDVKFLRIDLPE